jgi:hypothetical protein
MFTTEHFVGLWPDKRIFIITMHLLLQPELFKMLNTVQIRPIPAQQRRKKSTQMLTTCRDGTIKHQSELLQKPSISRELTTVSTLPNFQCNQS